MSMRLVVIESPYAGATDEETEVNLTYAAKLAIAEKQRDRLLEAIEGCVHIEEEFEDLQELSSSISIENHRAAQAEKAAQATMKLGLEMAAEAIRNRVKP